MITYDYNLSENNCFTVKHSNYRLNNNVEKFIIDEDKQQITIEYYKSFEIKPEQEIIFEKYNKFGILQNSTVYSIIDVIEKTNSSITYSYK